MMQLLNHLQVYLRKKQKLNKEYRRNYLKKGGFFFVLVLDVPISICYYNDAK